MGAGLSPDEARNSAWQSAYSQLLSANPTRISSKTIDIQAKTNGVHKDSLVSQIFSEGAYDNTEQPFRVLHSTLNSRPCNDGLYHSSILICIPGAGCKCKVHFPSNTGAAARSTLLPGWGQFYKGRTRTGAKFAVGVLGLAACGLAASIMSDQNAQNATQARTVDARDYYVQWRDLTYYASLGLFTSAVGTHLWNIFNAKGCQGIPKLE